MLSKEGRYVGGYDKDAQRIFSDARQWILVDLETKLVCGKSVSRRTFSSLLTPQYVNRIKEIKKKRKLYKSEN